MIPDPVLVDVGVDLLPAGELFRGGKRFEDRGAVGLAAAQIVDLAGPGRGHEGGDEPGDVEGVDIVADLLSFIAEDPVFFPFQVAFDQVAEKAVQLDPGMIRPGQAAAPQAAGRLAEVAAVFLYHDVGGDLGGAEEGMLGLVDREGFRNALGIGRVGVVPAGGQFAQGDAVGDIAVDLVRAHVHEGRFRAGLASRLEEIEGSHRVGVEIVERNGGGPVMARLGGGVDDGRGLDLLNEGKDPGAIANIEFVVLEAG